MSNNFCDEYKQLLNKIKHVGDCLDKAMGFAGKNQQELADFLKIDKSNVSRMINDTQPIHLSKIRDICKFLGNNLLIDYITYTLSNERAKLK